MHDEHYDPLDTHAQKEAAEERSLRDKLAREEEESDVKWLMSSKRGRRCMWRDLSGAFQLSFSSDALLMAFNEGNRNGANRRIAVIHAACPELYSTMVRENTKQ